MKFCILALALLGVVAADVAHLKNNMYLPPYMMKMFHQNIDYAQQEQEIPKVSPVEISDNSVTGPEEPTITTGQKSIQDLNNGLSFGGNVETHTEEKHDDGASSAETSAPASQSHTSSTVTTKVEQVAQKPEPVFSSRSSGSDDSTQQETAHSGGDSSSSTSTSTDTKVEQVAEEKEKKKSYLELLGPTVKPSEPAPDHTEETENEHTSGSVESHGHETATAKSAPTPGSDLITHQHGTSSTSSVTQEEEAAVPALGSRSSGVDTQYGANGGYVY